jgi:SAM-dependent methyltransferase
MDPREEWWKGFFQGVTLDFWSKAVPPEWTQKEADFLDQALALPAGAKVLDVPCGNGRLSLALARRGYRMTGVDIAAEYIEGARSKEAGVEWEQLDMRYLRWEAEFDGAFCFGNSFAYFDDAGNAALLRGVARALKPGGRFVLDTGLAAESILPNVAEREWYQVGDLFFLAARKYDPARGRLDVDYRFLKDGKEDLRPASYRIYTTREILVMLEAAGFGSFELYGGFGREPYALGSPRLLVVMRKAG